MNRALQLKGQTFGSLFVVSQLPRTPEMKFTGTVWRCRCVCGSEMIHRGGDLQSGNVKSCGCQKIALIKKGKRKHGHCSDGVMSTEYYSWAGMIARCTNPKNKAYKYYGGRGITVCERWLHSFQNFISDIGPKPESNWTIERVLVNGNYEPGNCKWATWEEQRLNKRKKAS